MINALPPISDKSFLEMARTTINQMLSGRGNQVGSFTLAENVTTTTVTDNLFAPDMVPVWVPTTANAAAAMTNLYVSARASGSFTLTHSNTATTDRTFYYMRGG